MTTISVIVPAYNQGQYLQTALASALAQETPPDQIIVIDDGSTDDTAAVTAQFGTAVELIRQPNSGLAAARNRGLAAAQADWIAFLDADDYWPPDYLRRLQPLLRQNPQAALIGASWQYVDAAGALLPQRVTPPPGDARTLAALLTWRNWLAPSGVLARRAAVELAGRFDAGLAGCADWDLWLRLLPFGALVSAPDVSIFYRTHAANMSDNIAKMENERLTVHRKFWGLHPDLALTAWPPPARRAAAYTCFVSALAFLRRADSSQQAQARLHQATALWPALLELDEFAYELAAAGQPRGWRGIFTPHDLQHAAQFLHTLLFEQLPLVSPQARARAWGRSAAVLARLAVQTGDRSRARAWAWTALRQGAPPVKAGALRTLLASVA